MPSQTKPIAERAMSSEGTAARRETGIDDAIKKKLKNLVQRLRRAK